MVAVSLTLLLGLGIGPRGQAAGDKGSAGNDVEIEFYQEKEPAKPKPVPKELTKPKTILPQTGEQKTVTASVGVVMLAVGSCYLLFRGKKEGKDEDA